MKYFPHIDGIRAISVLFVIFYHLNIPPFSGGFIGVDIFFVISGYLITSIINKKIWKEDFSLSEFYIARAKRLFPALFFVMSLCFIAAAFLFTPFHYQTFAQSAMSTVFSVSNIFFWLESDYFDISTRLKPLLHTWSLSVEWQFYLIWPFILLLVYKIREHWISLSFIAAFGILSFFANIAFQDGVVSIFEGTVWSEYIVDGASTIFYLFPFRIFEFTIGAILVWLPRIKSSQATSGFLMLVGLVLITYSAVIFDKQTLFPSYNALMPTIGAALLILTGGSKHLGFILRNPVSVYIGKISYSVYLIHWPMIVFLEYLLFRDLVFSESMLVLAASLIAGGFMHKFIEVPFYKGHALDKSPKLVQGFALPSFAVTLIVFSALIWSSNGWEWRINQLSLARVANAGEYHIDQYGGADFLSNEVIDLGVQGQPAKFVMVGDSHGMHYLHGLSKFLVDNSSNALGIFDQGCVIFRNATAFRNGVEDTICSGEYPKLINMLKGNNLPLIINYSWVSYKYKLGLKNKSPIEFKNNTEYFKFLFKEIDDLRSDIGLNHSIIIIGEVPGASGRKVTTTGSITDCILRPSLITSLCVSYFDYPIDNAHGNHFNKNLAEYSKKINATFINPEEIFCDSTDCKSIVNEKFMYSDSKHLSKDGSIVAIKHIQDILLKLIDK